MSNEKRKKRQLHVKVLSDVKIISSPTSEQQLFVMPAPLPVHHNTIEDGATTPGGEDRGVRSGGQQRDQSVNTDTKNVSIVEVSSAVQMF